MNRIEELLQADSVNVDVERDLNALGSTLIPALNTGAELFEAEEVDAERVRQVWKGP